MSLARSVSAALRGELARHRMSGAAVSLAAGLSQTYVSKRLRDEVPFTLNDVELLCKALGIDYVLFMEFALSRVHSAQPGEPGYLPETPPASTPAAPATSRKSLAHA